MKRLLTKQQVRFLIAGCFNTALDFLILNVLTLALGLPVLLANSISVLFGICISYALNHFFVFRYPYPISVKTFLKFCLLTGFSSLVIQNATILLFELLFDTRFGNSLLFVPGEEGKHALAINIAKATAVFLGLIWNFLAYRFIVFKTPDDGRAVEREPSEPAAIPGHESHRGEVQQGQEDGQADVDSVEPADRPIGFR